MQTRTTFRTLQLFLLSTLIALPVLGSAQEPTPVEVQNESDILANLTTVNMAKVTIKQGVWGTVTYWSGDFSEAADPSNRQVVPVVRTVVVYEITATKDVVPGTGKFIKEVHTKQVAETTSDVQGFFQVELPPGKYSLFVKDENGLYASFHDETGFIEPVTVKKGEIIKHDLHVDYNASW